MGRGYLRKVNKREFENEEMREFNECYKSYRGYGLLGLKTFFHVKILFPHPEFAMLIHRGGKLLCFSFKFCFLQFYWRERLHRTIGNCGKS